MLTSLVMWIAMWYTLFGLTVTCNKNLWSRLAIKREEVLAGLAIVILVIEAYWFTCAIYGDWMSAKQNCLKVGVIVQLCGWLREAKLWSGCVSDLNYNKRRTLGASEWICKKEAVSSVFEEVWSITIHKPLWQKRQRECNCVGETVIQPDWAFTCNTSLTSMNNAWINIAWCFQPHVSAIQYY